MDYLTAPQFDAHLTAEELAQLDQAGFGAPARAALAAQVSDEVAGYVGNRTLSHVPAALTFHAGEIARFRAFRKKASDAVKDGHDNAIKYLLAISAGKITLPLADDPATDEDESATTGVWFTQLRPLVLGKPW